jgi:hypothetical protein
MKQLKKRKKAINDISITIVFMVVVFLREWKHKLSNTSIGIKI